VLVEGGDILLVARETVERLGDDDVEGAVTGIFEQLLIAGAQADRAAHRMIV